MLCNVDFEAVCIVSFFFEKPALLLLKKLDFSFQRALKNCDKDVAILHHFRYAFIQVSVTFPRNLFAHTR